MDLIKQLVNMDERCRSVTKKERLYLYLLKMMFQRYCFQSLMR